MGQENVIRQLREYQTRWESEAEIVRRFIEFISLNAGCFDRESREGHVTGSAWVVNSTNTHVLLTHHKKLNRWVQLGGHADGDSDVLRVAQREAKEESGLEAVVPVFDGIFDIDVHSIPENRIEPAHLHWDIRYAFRVVGSEMYSVSEESHDLAWVEIQSIRSVTDEESVLRMASKWRKIKETGPTMEPEKTWSVENGSYHL